jgi:hypothetical protein
MVKLVRDQKIGLIIIICCVIILFLVLPFQVSGKKASFFPRFSLIWIIAWSLALVIVGKADVEQIVTIRRKDRKTKIQVIFFATCTAIYVVLINIVGFYSSSLLFLVVAMLVLGVRDIKKIVIIPILILTAVYFLTTKLFYFRFPRGFLF